MLSIDDWIYEGRFRLLLLAAFALIGLLAAIDIVADIRVGTDFLHVLVEVIVFVIAIGAVLGISLRLLKEARTTRELIAEMQDEIDQRREEALEWQNETRTLLKGLGESINRQFERWRLTDSEKEVALFLLKGLSHKEVAVIRQVSETTARQQARAIYQKTGLKGRHELAAFFLEELALPAEDG